MLPLILRVSPVRSTGQITVSSKCVFPSPVKGIEVHGNDVEFIDFQARCTHFLTVRKDYLPLITRVALEAPVLAFPRIANRIGLKRFYLNPEAMPPIRHNQITLLASVMVVRLLAFLNFGGTKPHSANLVLCYVTGEETTKTWILVDDLCEFIRADLPSLEYVIGHLTPFNSSEGEMPSAREIFTMFMSPRFRAPRSTSAT